VVAAEDVVAVEARTSNRRPDRFGLTWHPSIAAGVLANRDRLDLVEVIPEGRFLESKPARRALRSLARTLPVAIHGVSLGLASVTKVEPRRLEAFARLVGEVEPESWSEHLAFVRADGIELGHLAAASRTAVTVEATAEHVEAARRHVGSYPSVENVATPIDPPGSDRSEQEWLLDVLDTSPANLLLDLHNLYANGQNFGFDPKAVLMALPAERIRTIHLAGGVDVQTDGGETRCVDDHLHDVPDGVYELLEIVGARVPHAVDVVLERDGAFPAFDELLAQLDRAGAALARGRAAALAVSDVSEVSATLEFARVSGTSDITDPPDTVRELTRQRHARLEAFLARLYTDERLRARFVAAPIDAALMAGFAPDEAPQIARLDRVGLGLAAASFTRKRGRAATRTKSWLPRLGRRAQP
jgi:uncharacterized protein (UPF0276 family)